MGSSRFLQGLSILKLMGRPQLLTTKKSLAGDRQSCNAEGNSVELFHWKPQSGENFGDHLSTVIVTKILADAGFFLGEGHSSRERLLAVGSILHFARNGDHVWGSGV